MDAGIPAAAAYRIAYALADGAFFVPPASALFDEALKRSGTTFYMPTRAVPMLPVCYGYYSLH
eukprot:SAG31_NODE_1774_length_7303_cov_4.685453_4_plen_63_part_00